MHVGWLVVLRINVDLAIFQPYLDLEAGDNQSLKIQVARPGIEPGPLAPQAKSLTTRPPLLLVCYMMAHVYDAVSMSKLLNLAIAKLFQQSLNSISAMVKLF